MSDTQARGEPGWAQSCLPVPGGWQWSAWVAGRGGRCGVAYYQDDAEAAIEWVMAQYRQEGKRGSQQ